MHARKRLARWVAERQEEGRRQWEVAAALGISPAMLSHLCSGKRSPGLQSALSIERATGISMKEWEVRR